MQSYRGLILNKQIDELRIFNWGAEINFDSCCFLPNGPMLLGTTCTNSGMFWWNWCERNLRFRHSLCPHTHYTQECVCVCVKSENFHWIVRKNIIQLTFFQLSFPRTLFSNSVVHRIDSLSPRTRAAAAKMWSHSISVWQQMAHFHFIFFLLARSLMPIIFRCVWVCNKLAPQIVRVCGEIKCERRCRNCGLAFWRPFAPQTTESN